MSFAFSVLVLIRQLVLNARQVTICLLLLLLFNHNLTHLCESEVSRGSLLLVARASYSLGLLLGSLVVNVTLNLSRCLPVLRVVWGPLVVLQERS